MNEENISQQQSPREINWSLVKRFLIFCALVSVLVILMTLLLRSLAIPVYISFFLTYMFLPLVDKLDRWHLPRPIVVFFIISVAILLLGFASFEIFPSLYFEVLSLINRAPQAYQLIIKEWLPFLRNFAIESGVINQQGFDDAVANINVFNQLTEQIRQAINTIWETAPQVLGTVVNVVMVPLLTFVLLKDFHTIRAYLEKLVPKDLRHPVKVFGGNINLTFRSIIKGHATVAGILAILYVIGLSIIGLPSAVSIGIIAGICRFIPYLDVVVGGLLSLLVILSDFHGWQQIVAVTGVFMLVQSVDGLFITPRIIGDRAGLHPVMVILSILTFANLFGFWGVLVAIPTVALGRVIWRSILPYYYASPAYRPR